MWLGVAPAGREGLPGRKMADSRLDAEVVGAPVCDGLLDLFGGEVFREGAAGERGEFGVGGEAEGDELGLGEGLGEGEFSGSKQGAEAQAFFEADEAVLCFEGGSAAAAGQNDERDRHHNPPEEEFAVLRPVMNGRVDGEDEIGEENGKQDVMEGWVETGVVVVVLTFGHEAEFLSRTADGCGGWRDHTRRMIGFRRSETSLYAKAGRDEARRRSEELPCRYSAYVPPRFNLGGSMYSRIGPSR